MKPLKKIAKKPKIVKKPTDAQILSAVRAAFHAPEGDDIVKWALHIMDMRGKEYEAGYRCGVSETVGYLQRSFINRFFIDLEGVRKYLLDRLH